MLFRPEVIRNHRSARLGGIAISQPLGAWLLTLAATGMAAAIVAFLLLGSYTRRASVAGQLVPLQGVVTLPAPVTGIVERLDAAEGDAASAGQALAIIQAPRAMPESGNGGAALEQQIRQQKASLQAAQDAQQQQLRQQASGLNEQLHAARRELLQIEAEAATRQRQTRLAREKLARYQSLEKAGAASAVSVQEQQSAVFEHEAQTQTLLRQAASTRRLLAQLEQALRELPSQRAAARANHARDMAQLEQSEVQVRMDNRLAVTAPVAGVIAAQLVRQGQAVQAGRASLCSACCPARARCKPTCLPPAAPSASSNRATKSCCATRPIRTRSLATTPGAWPASAAAPSPAANCRPFHPFIRTCSEFGREGRKCESGWAARRKPQRRGFATRQPARVRAFTPTDRL